MSPTFLTLATEEMKLPSTEMRGLWGNRFWEMMRSQSYALGGHLEPLSKQDKTNKASSPNLTFLWRVGDKNVIHKTMIYMDES